MQYEYLGNSGIHVSKLCFGSLTLGPLQANLPIDEGVQIIERAVNLGVNFIDTAELYQTYSYIKKAQEKLKTNLIVATKSYSYTKKMMAASLEKSRRELDRDVIDIFLLHEQESIYTVKGHFEALEYLLEAKAKGKIRAVGLSTHTIKGVEAALEFSEIEIIHPIVNYRGLGILDGDINKMLELLQKAKIKGKGIYGMKPIGGGNLINEAAAALIWAFKRPELDAVAVGMQSIAEVETNIALLKGEKPDAQYLASINTKKRKLHIEDYCEACGQCVLKCSHKALRIEEGRAQVDSNNCVLCGYCGAVCPNFCIKII
ncbi:MAG: aldo/keto reductase [Peptococcaceae bacterium BICA1-8]|nr:MAG: aldo/keto reductase [Peptococcaceae bacterium BICA1-8]